LFIILISETTMIEVRSVKVFVKTSSSMQRWVSLLFLSLCIAWWKEKLLGKLSINLKLEENSQLRESKDGKILLR